MKTTKTLLGCTIMVVVVCVYTTAVASLEPVETTFRYEIANNGGIFYYPDPFYLNGASEEKALCATTSSDQYECQASATLVEFNTPAEIPGEVRMNAMAAGPVGGTNPYNGIQVQAAAQLIHESLNAGHALNVEQRVRSWVVQTYQVTEPEAFTLIMNLDGFSDFDAFNYGTSPPWTAEATSTITVDLQEIVTNGDLLVSQEHLSGFPVTLTETERQRNIPVSLVDVTGTQNYTVTYQLTVKIELDAWITNLILGAEPDSHGLLTGNFDLGSVDAPFILTARFSGDDSDNDGIEDEQEQSAEFCTAWDDADTDDDGILDGAEDANQNGEVDAGETDPCNLDSDGDGIQDGTELGYTDAMISADTDTAIFQEDMDPATTTNPRSADTDGDGLSDGSEDINANGRVDPGEEDPGDPFWLGDINHDSSVDLGDAVMAIQVVSGVDPAQTVYTDKEVNGDDKVGLEDAAYILQKVSGLR